MHSIPCFKFIAAVALSAPSIAAPVAPVHFALDIRSVRGMFSLQPISASSRFIFSPSIKSLRKVLMDATTEGSQDKSGKPEKNRSVCRRPKTKTENKKLYSKLPSKEATPGY